MQTTERRLFDKLCRLMGAYYKMEEGLPVSMYMPLPSDLNGMCGDMYYTLWDKATDACGLPPVSKERFQRVRGKRRHLTKLQKDARRRDWNKLNQRRTRMRKHIGRVTFLFGITCMLVDCA
jgi:hypothetical protein